MIKVKESNMAIHIYRREVSRIIYSYHIVDHEQGSRIQSSGTLTKSAQDLLDSLVVSIYWLLN